MFCRRDDESHPTHRRVHRAIPAASGLLVLARRLSDGLRIPPHRSVLSRLLHSGDQRPDVAAGEVRLALAPGSDSLIRKGHPALIPAIFVFIYLAIVLYIGIFAFRTTQGREKAEEF